jgi:hypothetical protein
MIQSDTTRSTAWQNRLRGKGAKFERLTTFDELMQYVKTSPSFPDAAVYDEDKEERLREKGLIAS